MHHWQSNRRLMVVKMLSKRGISSVSRTGVEPVTCWLRGTSPIFYQVPIIAIQSQIFRNMGVIYAWHSICYYPVLPSWLAKCWQLHFICGDQVIKQIVIPGLTWTKWKETFSLACDKMQFCRTSRTRKGGNLTGRSVASLDSECSFENS